MRIEEMQFVDTHNLLHQTNQVVLLLQGGGALGAYQVGASEVLAEACKRRNRKINWVAGISIGAINAAVMAAPKGGDAAGELEALWSDIRPAPLPPFDFIPLWGLQSPNPWLPVLSDVPKYWNWAAMAFPFGLPYFFSSRVMNPLLNPWVQQWFRSLRPEELAFYDVEPLQRTLERHVDFHSLKADKHPGTRLSVGATSVTTGEVVFFDTGDSKVDSEGGEENPVRRREIGPTHVMASGALPPAFPPVEIEGEWYFDGGVSSNTPIEILHDAITEAKQSTAVFIIDIWDRKHGRPLQSFEDVLWRQKSIQYGSRKKAAETVVKHHQRRVEKGEAHGSLKICQVMLETGDDEVPFSFSDADFSRESFARLRGMGREDMKDALEKAVEVGEIGGKASALYRYGRLGKHRATDIKLARQEKRQRAAKADRKGSD